MILLQIILLLLTLFVVSGIVGYSFSVLTGMSRYFSEGSIVVIPTFITLGFQVLILYLFILSFFIVGSFVSLIGVIVFSATILLYSFIKIKNSKSLRRSLALFKPSIASLENTIHFLPFTFVFLFFAEKINEMRWPPVGDVVQVHGPLTSLLLFNGRLTLSLKPLSSQYLYYPPGFHILAANVASWFDLLPAKSILLLGGSAIILIFWSIYTLTYMYTRSKLLSTTAMLSLFVYHPSGHLSRWIIGFLYNGTYPNLMAITFVIFSIIVLAICDVYMRSDNRMIFGTFVWISITIITLLVTYPPLFIFVVLMLVYLLFRYRTLCYETLIRNYKRIAMVIVTLVTVLTFLSFNFSLVRHSATIIISRFSSYYTNPSPVILSRKISFSYFYDHITGFAMITAFIISLLLGKKYKSISSMYFVSFVLLVMSLIDPHILGTSIFQKVVHQRFHMIPWLISWVIVVLGFYDLTCRFSLSDRNIGVIKLALHFRHFIFKKKFKVNAGMVILLSLSITMISLFAPSIAYQYNRIPNWYTSSPSWPHDYAGLLWIHKNIPPSDLILNDYSWAGLWILSLSYKNVTSSYFSFFLNLNRTIDLNKIWEGHMSAYKVYELLREYNVSYIFTTSEWGYWKYNVSRIVTVLGMKDDKCDNWCKLAKLAAEKPVYVKKPLSPSDYIRLFNSYPFLKLEFKSGNTAIYKVIYDKKQP